MKSEVKKEIIEYLSAEPSYSHVKKFYAVLDQREFKVNIVPAEQGGDELTCYHTTDVASI